MNSGLGINIAGHINGDFGLAQGVRSSIKAIEAAGIPFVLNNLHIPNASNSDTIYTNFSVNNPYPINFIHTNPDWLNRGINQRLFPILKSEYFRNRYNIGFWVWELPKFPSEWEFAFNYFDEIWTASGYCRDSISMVSPIPVLRMAHSLDLSIPSLGRESLGFPKDKFIFLFTFDFHSSFERKNPLAIIKAFKLAFGTTNEDVLLFIKFYNSHHYPDQREQLQAASANCSSIKLIDKCLTRDELNSLVYNCDCYISLHRAEGFGYTMAEAMYYGKPVIATAYSSNLDFMSVSNSFLVKYDLVTTSKDYGCYSQGSIWANPDIDHAAKLMHQVVDNPQEAKKVGNRAATEIKSLLSPATLGQRIRNRLDDIMKIKNIPNSTTTDKIFSTKIDNQSYESLAWMKTTKKIYRELKQSQIHLQDAQSKLSIKK